MNIPAPWHTKVSFRLSSVQEEQQAFEWRSAPELNSGSTCTQIVVLFICYKSEGESEITMLSITAETCVCCSEEVGGSRLTFCIEMNVGVPTPLMK